MVVDSANLSMGSRERLNLLSSNNVKYSQGYVSECTSKLREEESESASRVVSDL